MLVVVNVVLVDVVLEDVVEVEVLIGDVDGSGVMLLAFSSTVVMPATRSSVDVA
jgi:hypothetical protein